jgi:hypothetical protein
MRTLFRIAAAGLLALPILGVSAQETPGYRLSIVNPGNDTTVFSDPGNVRVQAAVVPQLANGDQVELLVDGEPAGPPSTTLDFSLTGIPRGQHLVQARVIDSTGNVDAISPSSIFYVWQASRLFHNRVP